MNPIREYIEKHRYIADDLMEYADKHPAEVRIAETIVETIGCLLMGWLMAATF